MLQKWQGWFTRVVIDNFFYYLAAGTVSVLLLFIHSGFLDKSLSRAVAYKLGCLEVSFILVAYMLIVSSDFHYDGFDL